MPLQRLSGSLGVALVVFLVLFLGLTDYLTGNELSFSIFYLIPISLASLLSGRRLGLLVSLISTITWLVADVAGGMHYSHPLIPYWNATVRLGYFTLHTILLALLMKLLDRTKRLALKDPLTGAANWRFFEETAERELRQARRSKQPLTVAYFDLDDFKAVNDTFGHAAGNDLLCSTVAVVQGVIRPNDLLARIGGDEFALLLPETSYDGAHAVIDRIRSSHRDEMARNHWPVTMSLGAVTFRALPPSVKALIQRADERMYSVKKGGKNNVQHEEWPA